MKQALLGVDPLLVQNFIGGLFQPGRRCVRILLCNALIDIIDRARSGSHIGVSIFEGIDRMLCRSAHVENIQTTEDRASEETGWSRLECSLDKSRISYACILLYLRGNPAANRSLRAHNAGCGSNALSDICKGRSDEGLCAVFKNLFPHCGREFAANGSEGEAARACNPAFGQGFISGNLFCLLRIYPLVNEPFPRLIIFRKSRSKSKARTHANYRACRSGYRRGQCAGRRASGSGDHCRNRRNTACHFPLYRAGYAVILGIDLKGRMLFLDIPECTESLGCKIMNNAFFRRRPANHMKDLLSGADYSTCRHSRQVAKRSTVFEILLFLLLLLRLCIVGRVLEGISRR
ncbi:MAG: hypothetical protein ACLQBD_01160 [Syntrophobacteraceae bacterium]